MRSILFVIFVYWSLLSSGCTVVGGMSSRSVSNAPVLVQPDSRVVFCSNGEICKKIVISHKATLGLARLLRMEAGTTDSSINGPLFRNCFECGDKVIYWTGHSLVCSFYWHRYYWDNESIKVLARAWKNSDDVDVSDEQIRLLIDALESFAN